MCMNVCLHVRVHTMCKPRVHGARKAALDSLQLELQMGYKLQHGYRDQTPSSARAAGALHHKIISPIP